MKVVGIDPGMRNLGWVAMEDGHVVTWGRDDIFEGAKIERDTCFQHIATWIMRHAEWFQWADIVVIEKQFMDNKHTLSQCLCVIQTALQMAAFDKYVLVHALTVKKHFQIPRAKTHPENKKNAVAKCIALWQDLGDSVLVSHKVDDVADAYLLARYQHDHCLFSKPIST